MIKHKHPHYNDGQPRLYVGYWSSRVKPTQYVDPHWDATERDLVVQRLRAGTPLFLWKGYSWCRMCSHENNNGTQCHTFDGSWVWPEGFVHYVEKHNVRPPQRFVDHLLQVPPELLKILEERTPRINAIIQQWEASEDGTGCPDKGVRCTFHKEEGSTYCDCHHHEYRTRSNLCIWSIFGQSDALREERKRHAEALKPYQKVPWESDR